MDVASVSGLVPGWTKMPPEIAEAVRSVMREVKGIEKKGKNAFHNYKFATIGDLMAILQPAMAENGLLVLQTEVTAVEMHGAIAVRYAFGLAHASGAVWDAQMIHTGMAGMINSKGGVDDKAFNKAHTAARKYFLLGLFQVPVLEEGDQRLFDGDPDAQEDKAPPRQATRQAAPPANDPNAEMRVALEALKAALAAVREDDLAAAEAAWERHQQLLSSVPARTLTFFKNIYQKRFGEVPPSVVKEAV